MTSKHQYLLPFAPVLGESEHAGVRVSASAHDVPRALTVVSGPGALITVSIEYSGGRHEKPVRSNASNAALEAFLGEFSGRLLKITIDADAVSAIGEGPVQDASKRLLSSLKALIKDLQQSKSAKASMNYRFAERGLGLSGSDAPPAWLIDAMQSRSARPSQPR